MLSSLQRRAWRHLPLHCGKAIQRRARGELLRLSQRPYSERLQTKMSSSMHLLAAAFSNVFFVFQAAGDVLQYGVHAQQLLALVHSN